MLIIRTQSREICIALCAKVTTSEYFMLLLPRLDRLTSPHTTTDSQTISYRNCRISHIKVPWIDNYARYIESEEQAGL